MPNTNKGTRSFEFFTDLKKQHDLLDFSKPIMVSCESIAPFTENNIMSDDGLTWYIDLISSIHNLVLAKDSGLHCITETIEAILC